MKSVLRVLYVEDEPDIQVVVQLALELGGMVVQVCGSGQEALLVAVEFGPDVLLLDVMLPGMDGPTTRAALAQLPGLADVPAVFMTAKVHPAEVQRLMATGAVGVITKPFDPLSLPDELRAFLAHQPG